MNLSPEQYRFFTENYFRLTQNQIAEALKISPRSVKRIAKKNHLVKESTKFKKGHRSPLHKNVGDLMLMNGYWLVKTENRKWEKVHRYVWEKAMGPIPNGFNIQFKDGNRSNVDISNLYIINKRDQLIQNTFNRFDPELREVIILSNRLKRKISEYEKQD